MGAEPGSQAHITTGPMPEFLVHDVEQAQAELQAGVEILSPVRFWREGYGSVHFRGPTATSTALSVAGTTLVHLRVHPGAFRERGMLDCAEVVAGSVVEAVAERAHAPTIRASTRPLQVSPSDTVRGAKYARSRDGGGWRRSLARPARIPLI